MEPMSQAQTNRRIVELKSQYLFLLNRDKPKGYLKEVKRVPKEVIKLKRKYTLRKIYIRLIRLSLPYLAGVLIRLPYNRRASLFLDQLLVLTEGNDE